MRITSPNFENNKMIPKEFTCVGKDMNPSLYIENVPDEAVSLALIVDDPDAPMGTWVHWVVYNISPEIKVIEQDSIPGIQGTSDFHREGYGGPCPPSGTHRYYFKLYALDTELDLSGNVTKNDLIRAMKGHIIEQTELVGLFRK